MAKFQWQYVLQHFIGRDRAFTEMCSYFEKWGSSQTMNQTFIFTVCLLYVSFFSFWGIRLQMGQHRLHCTLNCQNYHYKYHYYYTVISFTFKQENVAIYFSLADLLSWNLIKSQSLTPLQLHSETSLQNCFYIYRYTNVPHIYASYNLFICI